MRGPFGGIRTNPVTASYVRQLVECLRRYPASRAAIVPDNAFAYPVLGLRNALPINWLFPGLFDGSEVRLLETARRLRAEHDYVVLLQTFSAFGSPTDRPRPRLGRRRRVDDEEAPARGTRAVEDADQLPLQRASDEWQPRLQREHSPASRPKARGPR